MNRDRPLLPPRADTATQTASTTQPKPAVSTIGWSSIDATHFTFDLPPDFRSVLAQGIDSFAGEYRSNSVKITFDYGALSDPLSENGQPNYTSSEEELGGRRALLVSFDNTGHDGGYGYARCVHFPNAGPNGIKLTVFANCKSKDDYDIARAIFRSIRFK